MKYSCEIIKDVLALYQDDVCSKETKDMVETHLDECLACQTLLHKMRDQTYDEVLQKEKKHVVETYTKKIKRKSFTIGIALSAILMIPIIICLIVNLVTGNALDWFFIVLTSLMLFASISVVPLVVEEKKFIWTLGCFIVSLILLLLTCSLYSQANWFFLATVSVILGMSVVFGPMVFYQLPLKGKLANHKGALSLTLDTILLYLLLGVCGMYVNNALYWRNACLIATPFICFVWLLFGLIRYTNWHYLYKTGIIVILIGICAILSNAYIAWVLEGEFVLRLSHTNLAVWNTDMQINANIDCIILIFTSILGGLSIVFGVIHTLNKRSK